MTWEIIREYTSLIHGVIILSLLVSNYRLESRVAKLEAKNRDTQRRHW